MNEKLRKLQTLARLAELVEAMKKIDGHIVPSVLKCLVESDKFTVRRCTRPSHPKNPWTGYLFNLGVRCYGMVAVGDPGLPNDGS
jgi:hypothetical protein